MPRGGRGARRVALAGAARGGPVGLDFHTLVYAAFMVLVGFQATLMAVFARAYAVKAGLRTDAGWFARVWRAWRSRAASSRASR